ncbi:hypothetical protein ACN28C_14170 [Plantactinospora sp. WMMC1484]|uniref:hypothetical protein n=1 Tax=Plantactinospora sp. WMMC1484 TaxID=3404122 RepID=UPI003BF4D070
MFTTDAHFLLILHHTHADELRAEADSARLARAATRRSRRSPARAALRRERRDTATSRSPAAR